MVPSREPKEHEETPFWDDQEDSQNQEDNPGVIGVNKRKNC